MEMASMLGAMVEVTGNDEGGHVVIDPIIPMLTASLILFLVLLPILAALMIVFYKKKYQHQQILTAMDKGVPISDLIARPTPREREINWVRSLSAGIGFLVIGLLMAVLWYWMKVAPGVTSMDPKFLIIPIVIGGLGIIYLFRGILQRSCDKKRSTREKEPETLHVP